jgi:tRNA threonylcarbamoyladenosine biosynthesis protein TsaB
LVELIDAVLGDAGLDYGDLEVIAATRGPGSFTGVRSGVAAARALALATARPVLALSTLEVLAAAVGAPPAGAVVAALDARRGQVYAQTFGPRLEALSEPRALAPEDAIVGSTDRPLRLVGSGAGAIHATLSPGAPVEIATIEVDARTVARRALDRLGGGEHPIAGHALRPLYLRPPDARPASPWFGQAQVVGG